jgi:hypothetical protein
LGFSEVAQTLMAGSSQNELTKTVLMDHLGGCNLSLPEVSHCDAEDARGAAVGNPS